MGELNGQDLNSIDGLLFAQDVFQRVIENHFSERNFDLHLPNAGDAQENLVSRIFEGLGGGLR